jgi:hypothetical protein
VISENDLHKILNSCLIFGSSSIYADSQPIESSLRIERVGASSINIRLSAIRKLAFEEADNGWLSPETAMAIAHIHRSK